MQNEIKKWLAESRIKLADGQLEEVDLDRLEQIQSKSLQSILYLYSKSTNMRSQIAGWAFYDPSEADEPTLPSDDAPYDTVIDAVADGWRIVQFPIPDLYKFSDVKNQYLGYEFVLEKIG
ncbi:MAG: hypothetical protein HOH43_17470 [Candidatus Latescibacteria bacterium]|jgi:hypothetical protein|nr:hypothetical protein [Candidatus Latescibacterota bacterium]